MESTEGRTLLENVVISNEATGEQQYIRIPENSQIIGTELLQQHNGIVVDLNGSEFIPVSYSSEDLLSQDLTEEDRNLAAALVAVQLSQQQKQQQLQDGTILEQPLLLEKTSQGGGYLRIVNSENIFVEQQGTTIQLATSAAEITAVASNSGDEITETTLNIKTEDDKADSDIESVRNDIRTSKKSLPHKKRISRKLRKNSTSGNKKIVCNLCEQTFNNNDDFVQHELLCQTTITPVNPSPFNCQLCNTNFQDQLRFFEHLKKHYEPPAAPNAKPEKNATPSPTKTDKKSSTVTPTNNHDNQNQETLLSSLLSLTCIDCNKTFRRQKTFEAHMRDVHTNKPEPVDEFSEPEDLMAGIDVVVEDHQNEDDLEDDTKAWYREEDLHQTEEDLKELEEKSNDHVCHICKQPFPLRAILLQHLVTCRATSGNTDPTPAVIVRRKNKKVKEKEKLSCTECDRTFKHRNSLVYHMRSHTGIRPHQCELCGKSFFASSALKVHLRLHSGDKPYDCEHCGRKFRQWGDLKYHITSIHSNEKNYQCEYCGKEFARKYSLIVHRRIHTGERNYKCDYCGKCFRASSYLQNHRKIHTGEKPHPCSICAKPFRVRSDMKRHERTHGKGVTRQRTNNNTTNTIKIIQKEEIIENDESNELHIGEDEEVTEHILEEYAQQDPLEEEEEGDTTTTTTTTTVRLPNRNLYINGHELFLVTYPNEITATRTSGEGSSTTTWIHAATD